MIACGIFGFQKERRHSTLLTAWREENVCILFGNSAFQRIKGISNGQEVASEKGVGGGVGEDGVAEAAAVAREQGVGEPGECGGEEGLVEEAEEEGGDEDGGPGEVG